jgi:predicted AAA+ superfamily ATPase
VINYETLASDTGTSVKTIEGWLSVLEASYVIYKLKPYYENFGKRVIKAAKLFFIDTGLACYLLGIRDVNMLETHYLRGGLFENMVVMDIRKNLVNNGSRDELYYFRDNNKNEVDLLLESEGKQIPIEIKSSGRFDGSYLKGINYFKKTSEKSKDGVIVFAGSKSLECENYKVVSWKDVDKIGSSR